MCEACSAERIRFRNAPLRRVRAILASALAPACLLLLAGAPASSAADPAPLHDAPQTPNEAHEALLSATRPSLPYNGTITGLDSPFAVAINRYSRKIYVTESRKDRVVVFDRLGRRRKSFGAGTLDRPTALAFDFSGNLAVLSAGSRQIALFRPSGRLIVKARVPGGSPSGAAYEMPDGLLAGLAYEPVSRRLLVTDALANAVWTTGDGRNWTREKPPGLTAPAGADASGGHFFVVSSADARLMELTPSGRLIRALPLRGARNPFGVTFPPFGNGFIVSSPGSHSGLFGARLGGPLIRFGGARRMAAPVLPGSECTRVAFPDFTGNRVVAFDLPNGAGCVQGLGVRRAVTARSFRRIVASVIAENDSKVSVGGRVSVPTGRQRQKRYRLSRTRASLLAGSQKKLRVRIPAAAAAGIRRALAARRSSTVTLTFSVKNLAGDKRRVVARILYRPRALRGLAAGAQRPPTALTTVER